MCAAVSQEAVDGIARALEDGIADEVETDLASEDTIAALEVHFPDVLVRPLPAGMFFGDECSVDGYYDAELRPPDRFIFFDPTANDARIRFTVLHELGHHLLVTAAAALLDDIDVAAGQAHAAASVEELVCHRFAARLLIPDRVLDAVVGSPVRPADVVAVHDASNASWEAVVVRVAERLRRPGAVVLMRDIGRVSFCAGSRLEAPWWGRGSLTDPAGALAAAFDRDHIARREVFRHGQAFSRELFCDTQRVHDRLVVAVLSDKASDGRFDVLVDPDPVWTDRVVFCEWCEAERTEGWCELCRGRRCSECGRCGCKKPRQNPVCASCGLEAPMRLGETICVDCAPRGE